MILVVGRQTYDIEITSTYVRALEILRFLRTLTYAEIFEDNP